MANVMILGAHGQIATLARHQLLKETDHHLSLSLRNAGRLQDVNPQRETVIDGDVTDTAKLTKALAGIDVVYANLGNKGIEDQAKSVVKAMDAAGGIIKCLMVVILKPTPQPPKSLKILT